ncbi:MAG: ORF6N domain-containing protein [bacterium]|nr:ORF6N domain-containing protein [bacterium]
MLSTDLAKLYGVEAKVLIQAVKRNKERFPEDFMFQLTKQEYEILKSQNVTLNTDFDEKSGKMPTNKVRIRSQIVTLRLQGKHKKYIPYAFTEQGVAMLSSVLRSGRAISVNIEIMRTFVKLRRLLNTNSQMAQKIELLEKDYDRKFKIVFDALRALMDDEESKSKDPIGFRVKK